MKENIKLMDNKVNKHYYNLNGLRTIGALLIPVMHVLSNGQYKLSSSMEINVIMSFSEFVQLFFIISAFGMCCGYYDRMKNRTITLEKFYSKRYKKLFPFFAFLVLLDVIVSKGTDSFYEVFADLTLAFGLLPNSNISVIGVGWTLGVIFAFYMLFPFFVFMIDNKKRAWFSLAVSIGLFYCSEYYFVVDGQPVGCNFLRWSPCFVLGGLIYLYKEELIKVFSDKRLLLFIIGCICSIGWYNITNEYGLSLIKTTLVFGLWIVYAISVQSKFLNNKVTKFFSDISFEIYLSHMVIFRVIEKAGLLNLTSNSRLSYWIAVFLVLVVDVIFVVIAKKILDYIVNLIENRKILSSAVEEV